MKYLDNMRTILKNELIGDFIVVIIFMFLIYYLLILTSCSTNEHKPETIIAQQPALSKTDKLNAELMQVKKSESDKTAQSGDYKIGPEDLIDVDVFQAPELKTSVRVSSRGFIKLPLGGNINASGHSVSELEMIIAESLSKYMNEPLVSVFVKEYRSQKISVLGYVKTPGIFYVSGQKTVLDLISLAGGLTTEAGDICIIQRTSEPDQKGETRTENIVIDLSELLMNGHYEMNMPVRAGDVINVQKSGVFFVDGAVAAPGLYSLHGRVTLMQAMSMAKGLNWEASRTDIKIYRDTGKPEREVLTVSYSEILDEKTVDIDIKDKDIIIVDRNGFKSVLKGLAATLNFGTLSLGRAAY